MEKKMDRNRVKGMLWGLVVGDCLGSPIQFSGKDSHPWITEMEPCPVFRLPAGYWTDDSSMAMCVMDSYIRKEGYDLKDIGATFCKWLKTGYLSSVEGRSFDVGGATYSSCTRLAKGSLVNGTEDSQGNGSIMRFAPSYLIARKLGRAEVMHEVSDLTHASKRVREVVDRFAGVLDEHMSGKRTTAKSAYNTREEVNNSGWAVSTLEAALWAFETTDNFKDGMIAAVNLGGDSDSIGAVYGQVAGTFYGFDAIPERWVKAVKTWRKVDEQIERFIKTIEEEYAMSEKEGGEKREETVTISWRFRFDPKKYAEGRDKAHESAEENAADGEPVEDVESVCDPIAEELDAEHEGRRKEQERREKQGVVLSPDRKTVVSVPCSIESFTFPEGVERIGRAAFSCCENLKRIDIPDRVKVIEPLAFSDCTVLEDVRMPQNLDEFGFGVFRGCPKLKGRMILSGDGKELLCCEDFEGEEIVIPAGVEEVNYDAFPFCSKETRTIVIPESAYAFYEGCFKGCYFVTTVRVARKVDLSRSGLPKTAKMVVEAR